MKTYSMDIINILGDITLLPVGTIAMNKTRRFGPCGLAGTIEILFEAFQASAKLGVLSHEQD